jgi:hypothetical protein
MRVRNALTRVPAILGLARHCKRGTTVMKVWEDDISQACFQSNQISASSNLGTFGICFLRFRPARSAR